MQEKRIRLAFENGDSSSFGEPGWRNEWRIQNLASDKNKKELLFLKIYDSSFRT